MKVVSKYVLFLRCIISRSITESKAHLQPSPSNPPLLSPPSFPPAPLHPTSFPPRDQFEKEPPSTTPQSFKPPHPIHPPAQTHFHHSNRKAIPPPPPPPPSQPLYPESRYIQSVDRRTSLSFSNSSKTRELFSHRKEPSPCTATPRTRHVRGGTAPSYGSKLRLVCPLFVVSCGVVGRTRILLATSLSLCPLAGDSDLGTSFQMMVCGEKEREWRNRGIWLRLML